MEKQYSFRTNEDVIIAARWTDANGNPYDISAAELTVKKRDKDIVEIVAVQLVTGGIVKEALTFWLTARIAAGVLLADSYRYDFNVVRAADSWRINLLEGELLVTQGITAVD